MKKLTPMLLLALLAVWMAIPVGCGGSDAVPDAATDAAAADKSADVVQEGATEAAPEATDGGTT